MRIDYLREFVVLSETMNITQTARRLFMTQPVLSTHITSLEKEMGTPLLERSQHRIRLTKCGQIFLEEAKIILKCYDNLVSRIELEKNCDEFALRVGYLHHAYQTAMTHFVIRFKEQMPRSSIALHANGYRELMTDLFENKVDIAFTIDCDENLQGSYEVLELSTDTVVLVVERSNPLAQCSSISPAEIENIPLILPNKRTTTGYARKLNALFRENGISQLRVAALFDDVFSRFVQLQDGSSALPAMSHFMNYVNDQYVAIPFSEGAWSIPLIAVWRKPARNPGIKAMIAIARSYYEDAAMQEKQDNISEASRFVATTGEVAFY